ncbi:tRNA uridine-5-carboxymethylaminomethyl(34) synthesis GTPase MnmE [uncultured Roseobacter sp.]|uniref:tRNA uridine-5-carboxymethylaminomethyl(34) synthesis GTPase MnmE n=1 Tax=uncultured Roseobacter sp. TaxID=114847 RepID=UPI0026069722|nr:tRNA uridine-5-carboxymethylaminomethyl(34) synthesis GTPase MnmE [uncultured Roseobacter sp.]
MNTIFALATAQGRAGVSVIRISGSKAWEAASRVCGSLPAARTSGTRILRSSSGDVLDHGLVLPFQKPNSFTGEDVVEFHVHGSISVVQGLLRELSLNDDLRLAEPGEFTRRALENGKLDVSQVEGLSDLIDSETEAQRKQAMRVFSGALGDKVEHWRKSLIRAAALMEATIDFADEDVPVDVGPEVSDLLEQVGRDLTAEIEGSYVAERIRSGFEVALVGPPNAGKSTLLNRLAGREAAITSEIAGTTRDVIEVRMDLGGLPVTFLDTAGLRESDDKIEAIGVSRAVDRARAADLRVFLTDGDAPLLLAPLENDIVLQSKADLLTSSNAGISGKTGQGVDQLISLIQRKLTQKSAAAGLATHERHRMAMTRSLQGLNDAKRLVVQGPDVYDIASEELRDAIRSLETLVGRIDVESLLDEIFSSFCIGK